MAIIAKNTSNSGFTPVPAGMHLARCYRIIDMGTQRSEYQGKVKFLRKIMMQFEVHSEDDQGLPLVTDKGEPLSISKNYTLSVGEKATLGIDLESWRGASFTADERKSFDISKVLGAWAMITVTKSIGNDGKEYTNISNVNPVPPAIKKQGLPEAVNPVQEFSLDTPDMDLFNTFSDKIKEKIKLSPEWKTMADPIASTSESNDDFNDDIPF